MATSPFRFTRNERLHLNRDFKHVFKEGRVWHNIAITLFVLSNPSKKTGGGARIGIVVPRKTAGAVLKNKLKRRIREIFRLNKNRLKNVDLVVIGKKEAAKMTYSELEKKILDIWHKSKII